MNVRTRRIVAATSAVLMLVSLAAPVLAGDPADDLKQIEYRYYFRGKYPQAVDALQTFLARVDVTGPVAVRASEFLAASHVLAGTPDAGKGVFARLIAANPAYTGPDAAVFKPEVVDVYAQARAEYASLSIKNPAVAAGDTTQAPASPAGAASAATGSKPIYKKWWFYAGAAAVVGVVAGMAGSGGSGDAHAPSGTISVGVNVK